MVSTSIERLEISGETALNDFRQMATARAVETLAGNMKMPPRVRAAFYIGGKGLELPQIVLARHLKPGDWMRGYYRNTPLSLATGTATPQEYFAQLYGDPVNDPASGGRQMNSHWATRTLDENGDRLDTTQMLNWAADNSSTGSQLPPALGLAIALKLQRNEGGEIHNVAHVSIGDGGMMEGPALESVFQAAALKVPLVVSVYDNRRGISGTPEEFTPNASISSALKGLEPKMKIIGPVDGWDYPAVNLAYDEAFKHSRDTGTACLVHINVTQPDGHSSSGDPRSLRTPDELAEQEEKDCLKKMKEWLQAEGLATEEELQTVIDEETSNVKAAEQEAWKNYYGTIIAIGQRVHDACTDIVEDLGMSQESKNLTEGLELNAQQAIRLTRSGILSFLRKVILAAKRAQMQEDTVTAIKALQAELKTEFDKYFNSNLYGPKVDVPHVEPVYNADSPSHSSGDIISGFYAGMMAKNPDIVVFGQDVAKLGGVQAATRGLQGGKHQIIEALRRKGISEKIIEKTWQGVRDLFEHLPEKGFGIDRIWDTAIAEVSIIGTAQGLALQGKFPIVEIQYLDYLVYALPQIVDEIATLRHRTNGGQACPMLIRTHGHQLVGMWHTGSPMGMILSSSPGVRVLVPRDPVHAVALSRAALQGNDPCIIVDPLLQSLSKHHLPDNFDEICTPLGHPEIMRKGEDITIITYGQMCHSAMAAAKEVADQGISAEVVDLQTLNPLDLNGAAQASINKTGRVLFVDEDVPTGAMSMVTTELLHNRDGIYSAHVTKLLTSKANKAGYGNGTDGRAATKPQANDIADTIYQMMN